MIATGNYIGRLLRNRWTPPDPDALFDSRSGLTISDSIGGESITVGNFPMTFMNNTTGTEVARFEFSDAAITEPTSWTIIGLYKTFPFTTEERRPQFSYPLGRNLTATLYFRTVPATTFSAPIAGGTVPTIDWDTWQAIGYAHDASDNTLKAIWNKAIKSAADNDVTTASLMVFTSTQGTEYEKYYFRGFFAFNKLLSEAEINNIRLNGIFPDGADFLICPWLDVQDTLFQDHWDGVSRYKGRVQNVSGHGFLYEASYKKPTVPYAVRDSLLTGTYNLYKGYTRQGINVIPYKTDGTKGAHSDADDIEYPASAVIHNMAESMIDFSGVTDADIKAIFNKADRTYWNVSIEATDYYTLGAYLWHPSQLIREFIEVHAEAGHENHIFSSLRTSSGVVTGISAIRIYKTNIV